MKNLKKLLLNERNESYENDDDNNLIKKISIEKDLKIFTISIDNNYSFYKRIEIDLSNNKNLHELNIILDNKKFISYSFFNNLYFIKSNKNNIKVIFRINEKDINKLSKIIYGIYKVIKNNRFLNFEIYDIDFKHITLFSDILTIMNNEDYSIEEIAELLEDELASSSNDIDNLSLYDIKKLLREKKILSISKVIENKIINDPEACYLYARNVINGRFPEGERIIATSAEYSYWYAYLVIKNRFELGENIIKKSPLNRRSYNAFLTSLGKESI